MWEENGCSLTGKLWRKVEISFNDISLIYDVKMVVMKWIEPVPVHTPHHPPHPL